MSDIGFLSPMPDLGPFSAIPDPNDPEAYMLNVAAVVWIARQESTPKSAVFYRAFCKAWDRLRYASGSVGDRQAMALRQAFDVVGHAGPTNRSVH